MAPPKVTVLVLWLMVHEYSNTELEEMVRLVQVSLPVRVYY